MYVATTISPRYLSIGSSLHITTTKCKRIVVASQKLPSSLAKSTLLSFERMAPSTPTTKAERLLFLLAEAEAYLRNSDRVETQGKWVVNKAKVANDLEIRVSFVAFVSFDICSMLMTGGLFSSRNATAIPKCAVHRR